MGVTTPLHDLGPSCWCLGIFCLYLEEDRACLTGMFLSPLGKHWVNSADTRQDDAPSTAQPTSPCPGLRQHLPWFPGRHASGQPLFQADFERKKSR